MTQKRRASALSSRLDATRTQVEPYRLAWQQHNLAVLGLAERVGVAADIPWDEPTVVDSPLWVVLGDSAAQGVGASSPFHGWVGQVRRQMPGDHLGILNLSRSGARVRDVLEEQLPRLRRLRRTVGLVTCAIGGNDMYQSTRSTIRREFDALVRTLPGRGELAEGQRTVLTTLPQGLGRRRAGAANAIVSDQAPRRGIEVADLWATTGPPWRGKFAADMFHPNDVGYRDWADAIAPVILDGAWRS